MQIVTNFVKVDIPKFQHAEMKKRHELQTAKCEQQNYTAYYRLQHHRVCIKHKLKSNVIVC